MTDWTAVGDQMISHAELVKLGLDPKSIKITNPITGEEGYRAGLEVFHQLHCLNLLRQSSYPEYYNRTEVGGDVPTDAEDLRGHIGMFIKPRTIHHHHLTHASLQTTASRPSA